MTRTLHEGMKRRIAATLPKGVSPVHVLAEIESATQMFWEDDDAQSRYENIELIETENALKLTRRHYKSRGAPPKVALHEYVTTLVTIYERATGKRIGRNNPTPSKGAKREKELGHNISVDRREKPHPFLAACMKAAGKAYPFGIVRQLLESRRRTHKTHIVKTVGEVRKTRHIHEPG